MDRENVSLEDWKKRYTDKVTGWHKLVPHELLVAYFDKCVLGSEEGSKVLVPLCGRTVDIKWLNDKGCKVDGIEFEESAIEDFFTCANLKVARRRISDDFVVYEAVDRNIRIFQGDIFKFNDSISGGKYDIVWDRASFYAINIGQRSNYVAVLKSILTNGGKILLAAMDYDPTSWNSDPHYVTPGDVDRYFGESFQIDPLKGVEIVEKTKYGDTDITLIETAYLLSLK